MTSAERRALADLMAEIAVLKLCIVRLAQHVPRARAALLAELGTAPPASDVEGERILAAEDALRRVIASAPAAPGGAAD